MKSFPTKYAALFLPLYRYSMLIILVSFVKIGAKVFEKKYEYNVNMNND